MAHTSLGGEAILSSASSRAVTKAPSSKRRSEQSQLWQRGIQRPSQVLVLNDGSIQTATNVWEQQRPSQGRCPAPPAWTTCSQRPAASRASARRRRLSPSEAWHLATWGRRAPRVTKPLTSQDPEDTGPSLVSASTFCVPVSPRMDSAGRLVPSSTNHGAERGRGAFPPGPRAVAQGLCHY